jgi:geranylgeranyl reductase family protein
LTYDVVVVGAGPAGSTAAYECANMGLSTLILEKCALPREKPCGGAVMYRGIKIIDGDIPRNIVERKIQGLRFLLPGGKVAEFTSDSLIGITVFRDRFDEYLARRAEKAGALLVEGARVVQASVTSDSVEVELADGTRFRGDYLIGADGVNSIVSRSLGLRPKRKDLTKVGLGMESDFFVGEEGVLKATSGNPNVLEICLYNNQITYGWVFPKKEHLAIGVAGSGVHMRNLRTKFDEFCRNTEARLNLPLKLDKRRAFFLGGDGLGGKNVTQRTILIGDAAGFVDPMMGEGIAYAMQSGLCAASVISKAIHNERYDEEILSEYQQLCHDYFASSFSFAGQVGSRGTPLAELILPRMNGHKLASKIMAMVARGEIGYSDIPYTVMKNLPRELPNIIRQMVHSRIRSSN